MARLCPALLNILLALTIFGLPSVVGAKNSVIAQKFQILVDVENQSRHQSTKTRGISIAASYEDLFAPLQKRSELKKYSVSDLELIFRAAKIAAFYSINRKYVEHMALDINQLDEKGAIADRYYLSLRRAFIQTRMFPELLELDLKHPLQQGERLPAILETPQLTYSGPTEWVVSADKQELLRRPVNLNPAVQIVVISHPLCHFSQNAVSYIQSDPLLNKLFIEHAKWLAPQSGELNVKTFQQWNQSNAGSLITIAYKQEEWPMLDEWGTPTFYFFKAGVVVAKVVGWPKEGRRKEVLVALQKMGLLVPGADQSK